VDLFEYQAIAKGRWVMLDVAVRAILPGVIRLNEAGCGWETVAVGSQIGSQLGYPATP
jgi:hypothetical protein